MKTIASLLLLALALSMVIAGPPTCPTNCDNPKTEADCLRCFDSYSDIDINRFLGKDNKRSLPNDALKLQKGAWHKWDDNRCWIRLTGWNISANCVRIGKNYFGENKCSGYSDTVWNGGSRQCWVKFRKQA